MAAVVDTSLSSLDGDSHTPTVTQSPSQSQSQPSASESPVFASVVAVPTSVDERNPIIIGLKLKIRAMLRIVEVCIF